MERPLATRVGAAAAARIVVNRGALSLFQKVLLSTDGTVTDLVALYTGERIRVRKIEQSIRDECSALLRCAEPTALLHRAILLCGAQDRSYLYAESVFVLARLTPSLRTQMLETDTPVGLLWKQERLESFREMLDQTIEPCARIAHHFGVEDETPFVSRTYAVHRAGEPFGIITERWPISHFR